MPGVIIPGHPASFGLRLVVYAPGGARLGLLPHPLSVEAGLPLNDVPSLRVDYAAHAPGADLLADPCELALEYLDPATGGWIEPLGGRFLRIRRGVNHAEQVGKLTFTCPGYAWQLRKLVLYPGPVMVEGKRPFEAVTPGAILRTLIDEGHARGALPALMPSFTTTHDSAGQPWAKILTLGLEPGIDALRMLLNLAEQGVIDWVTQGRTLHVYNEGSVLARDRATGPSPVDLRLGRDIVDAPDDATFEDAASAILVRGEAGLTVEVVNPAAATPWGRWETVQSQGGVTDTGTATLLGQAALGRASGERVQLTRAIQPHLARWLPLADYRTGDSILAPGGDGRMQSLRIRQITVSLDADGQAGGNIVLGDRFLENDIKLARQAAGILTGSVSGGGTGSDPAPEPGGRTPAQPTGLIVDAAAYIDELGDPRGVATATWSPVTSDTFGVALDVDHYQLYARPNTPGDPWQQVAATDQTTAAVSPLPVNTEWAFKVRAVADGVTGEFSAPFIVAIPDDQTPPAAPSAPQVASRLGVIHVTWDGLDGTGQGMPADFAAVRVWMRDPLSSEAAQVIDHMTSAGTVVVAGQPYGADREFFLTATDRSGNESPPSPSAVTATTPLVDTDVIGQVISGTNIVNGTLTASDKIVANSITGALIQAQAITAGHLAANSVTADKIQAGAITAAKLESIMLVSNRIVAGNPSAARLELDSTGLRGYNPSGQPLVTLTSGGTFMLRTATTGARMVIDETGLRTFNASGAQTVTINAATGEADILGRFSSGRSGKRLVINPAFAADPEIRLYEDDAEYHYWTSSVGGFPPAMQIGSAHAPNGRKTIFTASGDGFGVSLVSDPGTVRAGAFLHGDVDRIEIRVDGRGGWAVDGTTTYGESALTSSRKARLELGGGGFELKQADAGNARTGGFVWCSSNGQRIELGVHSKGALVVDNNDVQLFGTLGAPGASGTFARGNFTLPAGASGASLGYGWTFTGGTAFVVGSIFNIGGTIPAVVFTGRGNGGFSMAVTPVPGNLYDFSYLAWKQ